MSTLIYIHGRGLKVSLQDEQQKWYESLQEGLTRLSPEAVPAISSGQLQLAYWSDIFYPVTPTAANPQGLPAHEQTAVNLIMGQYKAAQAAGRVAAAAIPQNDPKRVLGPVQMPATDASGQQASDDFVRDVIKYFGLGYAVKVRVPFVNLLTDLPLGDGLMVVTHSFGTLVAYDVLVSSLGQINATRKAAGKPEILVDTWVTMGSPLGWAHDLQHMLPTFAQQALVEAGNLGQDVQQVLNGVKSFVGGLFQHPAPAASTPAAAPIVLYELPAKQFPPSGVQRWFNIFDPRDPVSGEFGVGALTVADTFLYNVAGTARERAYDVTIKNEYAPAEGSTVTMDAHNDRGYGKCAELAQLVHDFWFRWNRPSHPSD
jgi:hypothetical protein